MQFKLDENLPTEAAHLFDEAGFDVATVLGQSLGGAADEVVHSACASEGRIVISADRGFADIRAYPPAASAGIVVLRLRQQVRSHVLAVLRRLLVALADEPPLNALWIVDDARIRARRSE